MTHDVHETVHAESCKDQRCIQEYENVAFVLKSLVQQKNLNKRYDGEQHIYRRMNQVTYVEKNDKSCFVPLVLPQAEK